MGAAKYIAIVIVALVALVLIGPFLSERTPAAYVEAENQAIRMQPTATAAALANRAEAIRVAVVAPAQATAEAASVLANNAQRISEDAHQQAMRHQGELAALTVTNTMRVNEVEQTFTARIEEIKAAGAKQVADLQADAARATAGAWRDTGVDLAMALGALILLAGASASAVLWLNNRARIINHPETGPILITRNGAMLLGRVVGPAIAVTRDGQFVLPIGAGQAEVTARQQAFALINGAMKLHQPEMARVAERAATAVIQQGVQPNPILDSAVSALPALNEQQAMSTPTFAELTRTWQPTRERMLLGINRNGLPVYCSLEDMLSTGVVGRPKTGKSTLLRFVFAQCVMVGAQVIVWDLHRTIVGSLPGANALTRLDDIDQSAERVMYELNRRIEAEDYTARPIMVLVDEFPLLAPNSDAATTALNRIILEGRKVNLFSMVAGQGLPAALFGGSTPRDALSSRYVLHTTTRMATMAGLEKDFAPWVIDLKCGSAVVDGPVDPQIVTIPNTTADDVRLLLPASRATSAATSGPLPQEPAMVSEPLPREAGKAAETINSDGPEAAELLSSVRSLVKSGKSQREIIAELWGTTGGRAYIDASKELTQMLQRLVP